MDKIKKLYTIFIISGCLVLSLTSCDSFLDIQPVGKVIPNTLEEYRALITTAYGVDLTDRGMCDMRTEDISVSKDEFDQNNFKDIERWVTSNPSGTEFGWSYYYQNIYYANAIINKKNEITEGNEAEINQLVGEAYFMRGYMHFLLVNLYGQPYTKEGAPTSKAIPLKLSLDLEEMPTRNTVEEIYASILSDIENARQLINHKEWETGYNYRLINAGKIENKGIEIALSTRPIQTRDFSWDINLNFSKNSNKVKELDGESDMFELEKASWLDVQVAAKVGENFGSIVGPDFQRNEKGDILIDPQTGLPQYDKSNHVLGNASWDWTGGLLTNFTYKNLSLVAVFDVKVGADLYSMSARAAYESGKSPETLAGRDAWYRSEEERLAAGIAKGADNWKPTGGFVAPGVIDNGDGTYRPNDIYINPEDYWMSVCRNAPSMFIYDNSYVKCRELTLSYNVPKSWLKNVVSGLTVSFVARNPFIVWKNIPNIDPDSNYNNTTGMGLEYGSLPSRRSYGFNVNVKF